MAPSPNNRPDLTTVIFTDAAAGRSSGELKALIGSQPRPNVDYFAARLTTRSTATEASTPFVGVVAQYPPTRALNQVDALRPGRSPTEAAKVLRRGIELTLERRLANAHRVGVMTGGGLDSGGLLALVHDWALRHGRTCFAVAVSFEDAGDDRPYLALLESHLGCEVLRISPEDGAPFFEAVSNGIDGAPQVWGPAAMELAAYSRAKAAGADCIVCGVGGDQLLDGQPRSLAASLREGKPIAAWSSVRRLRGFSRPRNPVFAWLVRPLLSSLAPRTLRARWTRTAPVFTPEWAGPALIRHLDDERQRRRAELRATILDATPLDSRIQSNRAFMRHRQQIEVATGLQRIDPYVDESLQALRDRIPGHWMLTGDVRRGLYREALRDVLPPALCARQDKSRFEAALTRFVRALGGFEKLRELSDTRMLSSLGLVITAPFQRAFEELAAKPSEGPGWVRVWPVLVLEAFARATFA